MSKTNVETLLHDRIETVSAKLDNAAPGTPEHKALAAEYNDLMSRAIEMDRVEIDCEDRAAVRENEQRMKEQEMADDKKDRVVKNIISAAGILLPLAVTVWGTVVSLKFEEEGTFTTIMGRGFVNKLLPKK